MKKSLLSALLVASSLTLTACEDKALSSKLQQAEATIAQLQTALSDAQKQLAEANLKLSTTAEFPALRPKAVEVFNQSETFKFEKGKSDEDEYMPEEGSVILKNTLMETGIEWLDQQLLSENVATFATIFAEQGKSPNIRTLSELQVMLKKIFQDKVTELKETRSQANELKVKTEYLGQWYNIATFSQFMDTYTGGAHGTYDVKYLNFDTDKQKRITLNDLIPEKNRQQVENLLWDTYKQRNAENNSELFVERKEFSISDQFYFTSEGVIFSFPPYAIGPWVEGIIELTLAWPEINQFINPDYARIITDDQ